MISKFSHNNAPSKMPPSVIIKTSAPKKEMTKIQVKDLVETAPLGDEIFNFCSFRVEESGYYSLSSQLCLRNSTAKKVDVSFFQFGVCSGTNYESDFVSRMVGSKVAPDYLICEKMNSVLHLEKDIDYTAWLNFSSNSNASFQFDKSLSHLRLYLLSEE